MSADTDSKTETTPLAGKAGPWQRLLRRYDARRNLHRRIPWRGYALSSINIVAIAFLVFDVPLGAAARDLPPQLIAVAAAVTDAGRLVWVLLAICAILLAAILVPTRLTDLRRRFRTIRVVHSAAYVAASVLSASIVVHLLKYAIGRARPPLYGQYGIFGFEPFHGDFLFQSFPSAHSAHMGALLAALALLFPRFRLAFLGLGLWLAATRIVIGVHYPSDVIAGLALGAWFAFATAILFSRFGLVFSTARSSWPAPRLDHGTRSGGDSRKSVKNL